MPTFEPWGLSPFVTRVTLTSRPRRCPAAIVLQNRGHPRREGGEEVLVLIQSICGRWVAAGYARGVDGAAQCFGLVAGEWPTVRDAALTTLELPGATGHVGGDGAPPHAFGYLNRSSQPEHGPGVFSAKKSRSLGKHFTDRGFRNR